MSTINEVAKIANVSKTTVFRVINQKGYVNKDTRENITKILTQLNFEAKNTSSKNKIAIIINNIYSITVRNLIEKITENFQKYDLEVKVAITRGSIALEDYYFNKFSDECYKGIILFSKLQLLNKFLELKKPIISYNFVINKCISSVTLNNKQIAKKIYTKLSECKNILIIKDFDNINLGNYLINELDNADKSFSIRTQINDISAYDGFFSSNDLTALKLVNNKSIPKHNTVISISNLNSSLFSSINYPVNEVSKNCVQLIYNKINKDNSIIHKIINY